MKYQLVLHVSFLEISKSYGVKNISSVIDKINVSYLGQSQVLPDSQSQNDDETTKNALVPVNVNDDPEKKKLGGKLQNWVKLNVGGKLFTTTRSTLVSKEPTSMLARLVWIAFNKYTNRGFYGFY